WGKRFEVSQPDFVDLAVQLREHFRHRVDRAHAQSSPLGLEGVVARSAADVGERQSRHEPRELEDHRAFPVAERRERTARDPAMITLCDPRVVSERTLLLWCE